ncbi:MAG: sigma-54-dependent Fis family transcriptional regulator [Lentisphaeria bacterium]|nr:sigma-54-dependent Fis family transcriptional regulator [Lentisphaeria bacterium]
MKEPKKSILIVDDERGTRETLGKFLRMSYEVTLAEDGMTAINLINRNEYDLVLSDIRMGSGPDGMNVLDATLQKDPPPPCILFTAYGSIENAVDAVKHGAFDFVAKPVNIDRLELVISRALESGSLKKENKELKKRLDDKFGTKGMIGTSTAMKRIRETIEQVAPSRANILITGESGTGKELVAQSLHQLSGRTGEFVAVNCAALPENLMESELFGHERGAFTGAVERKKGRFERAEGGTIFLDEIGEIPLQIQVKLLRVLESRTYERVGGTELLKTDARVVAATNRDLKKMVEEGSFREDLYYRLNVVSLELPPLRERKDDIPLLVAHYLELFSKENGRDMGISPEAMAALTAYRWPGNIRELRNCVERMVVLSREKIIGIDSVPYEIREQMTPGITKSAVQPVTCDLERNEKLLITKALNECNGNRTRAAEKLGISRRTLLRKLKAYSME